MDVYGKLHVDRVFFIVDRTRLKDERDELKNALVVYVPEKDLNKPSLEQRCSQLVGISILVTNFIGKLPKFIRLKSYGFAIRQLGTDYIMGLQSKMDEPKWCVQQLINRIHDFFIFYYSSPSNVMEMALGDWEIFTTQMNTIFQCILEFTFRETHNLPSMFNPLPYVALDSDKGGTQLYLKAQRLLRCCQLNEAVIGGCMFYNGELLCSQLPPDMGEKLLLVANGGVELNSRTILEDQVVPETVWVINIFLTSEELALSKHLRRPTKSLESMYTDSLQPNPNLESLIQLQQRFQAEQVEKLHSLSRNKKTEKNEVDVKHPLLRINSNESEDFVTISYGRNSVSFTKKTSVNPLKRSKKHGKRNLEGNGSATSLKSRNIFDPLPPLPRKSSEHPSLPGSSSEHPPSLPRLRYEEDVPPVPERQHHKATGMTPPEPPPRKAKVPPDPPPRLSPKHAHVVSDAPPPVPPPRNKSRVPPPLPIKISDVLDVESSFQGKLVKPVELVDGDSSQVDEGNGELSSPGVYGTPMSSFDVDMREELCNSMAKIEREESLIDSDQSEGYRTPPPSSPFPGNKEMSSVSTSDASTMLSQSQTFFTPLGQLSREGTSSLGAKNGKEAEVVKTRPDVSLMVDAEDTVPSEVTPRANGYQSTKEASHSEHFITNEDEVTMRRKGMVGDSPFTTTEENHYEFDHTLQHDVKKISTGSMISDMSDISLVITKAISEVGSVGSLSLEDKEEEVGKDMENPSNLEHLPLEKRPQVEISEDSLIDHTSLSDSQVDEHSPVPYELSESISDLEDQVGGMVQQQGKFHETMRRSRADTWMMMSPTQARPNETQTLPEGGTVEGLVMHKKCLYIQRCVNTVVAILADEDLPNNPELIKNLWTSLLSWLILFNNAVDSSVKDQDSIYSSSDSAKPEPSFKAYHAGYSKNIGMCEVSSITAPYQFRHAVRRVHHEYAQDSSLRQVSLCKDHCKMISQSVLGREVYYHSTRLGTNDALLAHSALEKQVKAMSKQHGFLLTEGFTVNFL